MPHNVVYSYAYISICEEQMKDCNPTIFKKN